MSERASRAAPDARQAALPKRFYKIAGVAPGPSGFALALDERTARTPARLPLAVSSRALAEALAEEWQAQEDVIDPARMPLTRIVNSAIDGVASRMDEVRDDLLRFAGSDLVCYRAGEPASLVAAQAAAWDPVLAWARQALGARLILSEGVMHAPQPAEALAAIRARLAEESSAEALAALHVMTTLTGSVLISLAQDAGRISAEEAWAAAHVDETFQERAWGEDAEALARRARRKEDFDAACRVRQLVALR